MKSLIKNTLKVSASSDRTKEKYIKSWVHHYILTFTECFLYDEVWKLALKCSSETWGREILGSFIHELLKLLCNHFSTNFPKKGRLDAVWRLSSNGFLQRGQTNICLRGRQTIPPLKEEFATTRIQPHVTSWASLASQEEHGSNEQGAKLTIIRYLSTSFGPTSSNHFQITWKSMAKASP